MASKRPPDRRHPTTLIVFLIFYWLGVVPVLPWGQLGHESIADLAQTLVSNNVLAKVRVILNTNDLASVALWADQARQLMKDEFHPGPLKGDAEAERFIQDHPDNDKWHFADLPLGTFKYVYEGRFAVTNDIVHSLDHCVAVLEGKSKTLTRAQALRYVIHLVGDIHQPLHVGCGYYVSHGVGGATLLKDPDRIDNPHAHDAGANLLLFVTGHTTNKLHAYWDDDLVRKVDTSPGNAHMLEILRNTIEARRWKSEGNYHDWPALWAKDSVTEANAAYDGITFGAARFTKKGKPEEIDITLAATYEARQTPRVTRQLAKAAFHLAELLNRIHWQ